MTNKKKLLGAITLVTMLAIVGGIAYYQNAKKPAPDVNQNSQTTQSKVGDFVSNTLYIADMNCGEGFPTQKVLFITNPDINTMANPGAYPVNEEDATAEDQVNINHSDETWGMAINLERQHTYETALADVSSKDEEQSRCTGNTVQETYQSSLSNISPRGMLPESNEDPIVQSVYYMQAYSDPDTDVIVLSYQVEDVVYEGVDYTATAQTQYFYKISKATESTEILKSFYSAKLGTLKQDYSGGLETVFIPSPKHIIVDHFYCSDCGLEMYTPTMFVINTETGAIKEIGEVGDFEKTGTNTEVSYKKIGHRELTPQEITDAENFVWPAYHFFYTGNRITTKLP